MREKSVFGKVDTSKEPTLGVMELVPRHGTIAHCISRVYVARTPWSDCFYGLTGYHKRYCSSLPILNRYLSPMRALSTIFILSYHSFVLTRTSKK